MMICRPIRGRYGPPIPASEARVTWRDECGRPRRPPQILGCASRHHVARRRRYSLSEMFVQLWTITVEEVNEAMTAYDLIGLHPLPPRFVCAACAARETDARSREQTRTRRSRACRRDRRS
jgi:hypothetical protein